MQTKCEEQWTLSNAVTTGTVYGSHVQCVRQTVVFKGPMNKSRTNVAGAMLVQEDVDISYRKM